MWKGNIRLGPEGLRSRAPHGQSRERATSPDVLVGSRLSAPPIRPRSPPDGRSAAILTAAAGGVGPRGSTTGLGEKRNACDGRRGPERGPSQPSQYIKVENKAESRSYITDPRRGQARPGRALPPTPPSTLTCSRRRSPSEESEQRVQPLFIEREGAGPDRAGAVSRTQRAVCKAARRKGGGGLRVRSGKAGTAGASVRGGGCVTEAAPHTHTQRRHPQRQRGSSLKKEKEKS